MQDVEADRTLTVVRQDHTLGAARDLELGLELLTLAKTGGIGPTLRLYRPAPTVAFGQRDTRLPGFEAAAQTCRDHGFEPLVRKAGGRAAAYHEGTLVAQALRDVGVQADVGEIPGEYCPGEFSVHGTHPADPTRRVKLVGTAQRVVSGGWLFSSVIVVENSAPIRAVLTDSYAALGLDWDPSTAGAADDLVPGLTVQAVEDAVVAAYAGHASLHYADFGSVHGREA